MKKLQKSEFLPVLCVSRAVFKDNCPSPHDLLEEAVSGPCYQHVARRPQLFPLPLLFFLHWPNNLDVVLVHDSTLLALATLN